MFNCLECFCSSQSGHLAAGAEDINVSQRVLEGRPGGLWLIYPVRQKLNLYPADPSKCVWLQVRIQTSYLPWKFILREVWTVAFSLFFRAYRFDNLLPGSVYTVEVSSVSGDRRSLPAAVNTKTRECDYTYIGTKLSVSHKFTH